VSERLEGQAGAATQPWLVVTLRDGATCELRTDRIVVGGQEYPLTEIAWTGLVIDPTVAPAPGAPPPPAILLRLRGGRDVLLSPAEPPAAWQLLGAIYQARPDLRAFAIGPTPSYALPPPGYGYGYAYAAPGAPSSSDTVLAGLSHLSVFFAPVILPLIVWLAMRKSSPYASQQGKQAFFFHLVFWILSLVFVFVWIFGFPFLLLTLGPDTAPPDEAPFFLAFFAIYGVFAVGWLIEVIFSIIGAVQAFQGKPFHYPLLGWL
jgi:uncharacterized Tic20 family protein